MPFMFTRTSNGKMDVAEKVKPAAHGRRWNNEEKSLLLDEIANGIPIHEIAAMHNRSVGGISSRLSEIAVGMYADGRSTSEMEPQQVYPKMKSCWLTNVGKRGPMSRIGKYWKI